MEKKRDFTLRLNFGEGARSPTDKEMFDFFREQNWKSSDLSAFYREKHLIFVRFKNQRLVNNALIKLGSVILFKYDDGKKGRVFVNDANVVCKYVRLFGLPPEVNDVDIETSLEKFGKVQYLVRERYSADTGYPIWNGNRGAYMELVNEIPSSLEVGGVAARIHYDGQTSSCFKCGSQDHLKVNCSGRKRKNNRLPTSEKEDGCSSSGNNGSVVTQPGCLLVVANCENREDKEAKQIKDLQEHNTKNNKKGKGDGLIQSNMDKSNREHAIQTAMMELNEPRKLTEEELKKNRDSWKYYKGT